MIVLHAAMLAAASCLAAVAPAGAEAAYAGPLLSVVGRCDFSILAAPGAASGTVAVVGHTVSGGTATGVRCVLRNTLTGLVVYDRTAYAPTRAAVLADTVPLAVAPYAVCWQGVAIYADGTFASTPLVCGSKTEEEETVSARG